MSNATGQRYTQSRQKWSAEEDALIIQLRGFSMKWGNISQHLPGRSPVGCRMRYHNYLQKHSKCDEERKNKLARTYETFKSQMWAKVAEEMAMPWQAAEAMHWLLGADEMARRAGAVPFSIASANEIGSNGSSPSHSRVHHQPQGSMPGDLRDPLPRLAGMLPGIAELTSCVGPYSAPASMPNVGFKTEVTRSPLDAAPAYYSIGPAGLKRRANELADRKNKRHRIS